MRRHQIQLTFRFMVFGVKIHEFTLSELSFSTESEFLEIILQKLPLPLKKQVSLSTIQLYCNGARIQFTSLMSFGDNECVEIVLPSIEDLDLSSKNLTKLQDLDAKIYSNLKHLNLEKNQIETVPISLYELKKLKVLVLRENYLKSLPDHMETLSSLTILDISKNTHLKLLPNSLASLKRLKIVSISSTAIEEVSSNFIDFVKKGGFFDVGQSEEVFPPLKNPPINEFVVTDNYQKEIQNGVIKDRLIHYWEALISDKRLAMLHTIPVVILGKTRAGKTTFALSLINGSPTHSTTSTICFERHTELCLNNPKEPSSKLFFRILDVGGQECYGILHTFLLDIGNPKNLLTLIVVNAAEYYKFLMKQGKTLWDFYVNYMKHCGIWLNNALNINQFSIVKMILSHTDTLKVDEVLIVKKNLEKEINKQLDDRISHLKKIPNSHVETCHLVYLKTSLTFHESACYPEGPANSVYLQNKFSKTMDETKKALAKVAVEICSSTEVSYPTHWQKVIEYILGCAERCSEALLSRDHLKKKFPDLSSEVEAIVDYLGRRRIVFPFPSCEYFCPSPYHLQSMCKLAVDHTVATDLCNVVGDVNVTGNVPLKILESAWMKNEQLNKKEKAPSETMHKYLRKLLLLKLAIIAIIVIAIPVSLISNPLKPPTTALPTSASLTSTNSTVSKSTSMSMITTVAKSTSMPISLSSTVSKSTPKSIISIIAKSTTMPKSLTSTMSKSSFMPKSLTSAVSKSTSMTKSLTSTMSKSTSLLSTSEAFSSAETSAFTPPNISNSPTWAPIPLLTTQLPTSPSVTNLTIGCVLGGIAFFILVALVIIMKHKQQTRRRTHAEFSIYSNHKYEEEAINQSNQHTNNEFDEEAINQNNRADDSISITSLIPPIPPDEWFSLMKNIFIMQFMCSEVHVASNSKELRECLHLPFLLRKYVTLEECLIHWPLEVTAEQLTMEFWCFPLIPPGMLSSFLNILRNESGQFFNEHKLVVDCLWQGGMILTLASVHTDNDLKILIQGVNYSFNPDDLETHSPNNCGPYKIDENVDESKTFLQTLKPSASKILMYLMSVDGQTSAHFFCMAIFTALTERRL